MKNQDILYSYIHDNLTTEGLVKECTNTKFEKINPQLQQLKSTILFLEYAQQYMKSGNYTKEATLYFDNVLHDFVINGINCFLKNVMQYISENNNIQIPAHTENNEKVDEAEPFIEIQIPVQNDSCKDESKPKTLPCISEQGKWFKDTQNEEFEIIDEDKALTCFKFIKHLSNSKIKMQTFFRALAKADFSWWNQIFERCNRMKIGLATIGKANIVNNLQEWKEKAVQSIDSTIKACRNAWGQYHNHEGLLILEELGIELNASQKDVVSKLHCTP